MQQKSFTTTFLESTYDCHYITEPTDALKALASLIKKDVLFAIDTETAAYPEYKDSKTAGLSPHLSQIRLLQVFDGKNAVVFDLRKFTENMKRMFLPFLSTKRFVAHYAVFDLQRFIQMGVQDMNLHCTHILAKLIFHANYPHDMQSASLDGLAESLLKTKVLKQNQASDWSEPELTFEQIEYAAIDVIACLLIANKLAKGLDKFGLDKIYKLEKDVQHPIAQMQLNGFRLDADGHRLLIPGWLDDLVIAKKKVEKITGITKLTAPKLGLWLEKELPADILAIWPRTDTGKLSTSSDTFADFDWHEVVKPFATYQKKAILCSTFGQNLINQINPKTKCLHPHFKQMGARTGRLSCSAPNLQNLPRDKTIRSNFVADEGHVFLCADYSQIELRIAAEVSGDKKMQKAYREGIDLHRMTASAVLNKPIGDTSDTERQIGKALGLGLLYGLGAKKFSHYVKKGYGHEGISVSHDEAFDFIDIYRGNYSGFRDWQLKQAAECEKSMVAVTPFGKRRKLDDATCYGGGLNMPIQGAAAEVIKCSLIRLEKTFRGVGSLVNCIHDENLLQVPDNKDKYDYLKEMQKCMVSAYLDVFPNGITRDLIEANFGYTWTESRAKPSEETKKLLQIS